MVNKDKSFTQAEKEILKKLDRTRLGAKTRFPLLTALFATFGAVTLLAGFQAALARIEFLHNNPWLLVITGLLILTVTGTVYKKLD